MTTIIRSVANSLGQPSFDCVMGGPSQTKMAAANRASRNSIASP